MPAGANAEMNQVESVDGGEVVNGSIANEKMNKKTSSRKQKENKENEQQGACNITQ